MSRSSSFSSFQPAHAAHGNARTSQGAADFLRAHDKLASLLPTVTRMAALQKDCASLLPEMFSACAILQFESEQLMLSTPNAAVAARLKQKLPHLQDALAQRGWQVKTIRLKVQVTKTVEKSRPSMRLSLPQQALSALATLDSELEESTRNHNLKAALSKLLAHHRDQN